MNNNKQYTVYYIYKVSLRLQYCTSLNKIHSTCTVQIVR